MENAEEHQIEMQCMQDLVEAHQYCAHGLVCKWQNPLDIRERSSWYHDV